MRLLLDTHLLLWAAAGSRRLSAGARNLIEDTTNELLFSVASMWEIVIKRALRRGDLRVDPQALRHALLDKLPPDLKDDADAQRLREYLDRGSVNIVHLIYRSRAWESGARDFEFSRSTMLDHWSQGRDAVEEVMHKGDLIARNITNGKSATFDLQAPDTLKEKNA